MGTEQGDTLTIIQSIQLILAPAVMINACGLLLLSVSTRYSMILNRIRSLNEEKRKLARRSAQEPLGTEDNLRIASIARQLDQLLMRGRLARNAVLSFTGGIALFVVTSLLIGAAYFVQIPAASYEIISLFLLGMVSALIGIIYGFIDARQAYDVVMFDVAVDE